MMPCNIRTELPGTYTVGWHKCQLKTLGCVARNQPPNPLWWLNGEHPNSSLRKFKFPLISTNRIQATNLTKKMSKQEARHTISCSPLHPSLLPFSSSPTYSHSPKLLCLAYTCPNFQLSHLFTLKKPSYYPKTPYFKPYKFD